jgi:hypothetical protein
MQEKLLPKIQILCSILFGLIVLFAPFVVHSLEGILLLAAAAGFGLGVISVRLGWVVMVEKKIILYPFEAWSLPLLKMIFGAEMVLGLEKQRRKIPASRQKWMGIANLVCGGLVIAITIGVLLFALSQ